MRDSRNTFMVKPCDICGDIGFEEKMVTCFQCQNVLEHVYCMRVLLFAIPEIWLCEACRLSRGKVSAKCVERERHSEALASSDISREAMKPSTGAKKPPKLSWQSDSLSRPDSQTYDTSTKSKRISNRFKITPPNSPVQMINSKPGVRAAAHCRPPKQGSVGKQPVKYCHLSQTSEVLNDNRLNVCKEEPEDSFVPANMVETSNKRVKKESDLTPLTSMDDFSVIYPGDILNSAVQSKSLDIKERNLQIMPIYELYNSFSSRDATWCGSIKVGNLESCSEFFDGFQAYLANKVHHKAFEIAKQMPGVLTCSLLPRCNIWLDVFQNDPPDINDIALIFLPGNFPGSKQKYVSLLGLVEKQDGVLKTCVNGVDLLIFSCTSFRANSSGFQSVSFLCGLYSTVKGNRAVPQLLTHDRAEGKSSNRRTNLHQSLSEVKIESYYHPDVPPGFSRLAAAAAATRR